MGAKVQALDRAIEREGVDQATQYRDARAGADAVGRVDGKARDPRGLGAADAAGVAGGTGGEGLKDGRIMAGGGWLAGRADAEGGMAEGGGKALGTVGKD